jgi:hypothetical protein
MGIMSTSIQSIVTLVLASYTFLLPSITTGQTWQTKGRKEILEDPVVAAAMMELQTVLKNSSFKPVKEEQEENENTIFAVSLDTVDVENRNDLSKQEVQLLTESAYEIRTDTNSPRTTDIQANTPLGLAYALFDISDRVRIHQRIPDINTTVIPALPYRFLLISPIPANSLSGPDTSGVEFDKTLKRFERLTIEAVKYGYNFIVLSNAENFFPWVGSGYEQRSKRFGAFLKRFIEIAHRHHVGLLLIGDEFVYLPELLEQHKAKASVKDEHLWFALQTKYRDFLNAFPELDGVATRIGEIYPHYDFKAFDLIHSQESEPNPRIEERYRRFIQTIHKVVVQEYGKIYLHRTWVTNVHEQHSIAEIYRNTFTDDVPMENLLLAIKLTSGDQWYPCEPYNDTFGRTPHTTIAQGEIYSGYQGHGSLIEYPARYFQAALQWAFERQTKGVLNTYVHGGITHQAILHTFSRLAWNPNADVEKITSDWIAANFGKQAANEITDIFLMASIAVRDGLYLRQPGLHNWSPLRHVRVDTYVRKGNPIWDHGKEHERFLKDIYLECKPWLPQTIEELNHGVNMARQMLLIFEDCKHKITNPQKAAELENLLKHGCASLQLNRAYVIGFLRYFQYKEQPTEENKSALTKCLKNLNQSVEAYQRNFNYYKLIGIKTFIDLAERALSDLDEAERILSEAPSPEDIQNMFAQARLASEKLLKAHPDAIHIASWQGSIDGRDIVRLKSGQYTIEHLAADPIGNILFTWNNELPSDQECLVVVKPLEVRGTVFIMDQPSVENEQTITLYLEDPANGSSVFKFEVYAIPR